MENMSPILRTLGSLVASVISLAVTLGAPIASVGTYDLHLFPRRDAIAYDSSATHLVSQISHSLSLAFLASALIILLAVSSTFTHLTGRTQRGATASIAVLVTFGLLAHILGLITLGKAVHDWKRRLDQLPVPLPDVHVTLGAGAYAEIIGLVVNIVTTVLAWLALRGISSQSFVRLP